MTKKELSQLRHLKYEARELMDRIKELESSATSCATRIDDLPKSRELTDKVGNYAIQIAELRKELDAKLYQLYREYVRLSRYIANVKDSQMRVILALRYIKGFTWQKIAYTIGEHDEQYPRKKHNAFLENNSEFGAEK